MSPGRRIALLGATLLLTTTALLLGRWQLRRLDARRAANAAALAARTLPPIDLAGALDAGVPLAGRRLRVSGAFEPIGGLLLWGRVLRERKGLEVATPFRLAGRDEVLWVVRGFVGSLDAMTPPALVPTAAVGTVTLEGIAADVPVTDDAGQPAVQGRDTTWRRLDRGVLASRRARSLPVYLLLQGDSTGPGGLPTVPPPDLTDGPHFSYAIQWFGIALAIAAFGVMVLRRDGRGSSPPPAAP